VSFRAAETARNLAPASYACSWQKAHIAFETSFGALRQPALGGMTMLGAPSRFMAMAPKETLNTNQTEFGNEGKYSIAATISQI
jgi:hypothetical protein